MDRVLAVWNSNLIRSLVGGDAKAPAANQSSGPAASPPQNQPGVPDHAIRSIDRAYPEKKGNTYWARLFWRIRLFHQNQKDLGRGIQFREEIRFSGGIGFMQNDYWKGEQPTRDDGSVDDPWGLAFNRSDGQVKVIQTIFAGGRQATWEAVVHANSTYEAQQYIPFH